MGSIKNRAVRTLGKELIKDHSSKFSGDFTANKQALSDLVRVQSKKMKNKLAGYITREMKRN